jgi:hypothetical protein
VRVVDVQGVPGAGQFVQLLQAAFELNTLNAAFLRSGMRVTLGVPWSCP